MANDYWGPGPEVLPWYKPYVPRKIRVRAPKPPVRYVRGDPFARQRGVGTMDVVRDVQTELREGTAPGQVVSSGLMTKARNQAQAEAELKRQRRRYGVEPEENAAAAEQARWEREQEARQEAATTAFGRETATREADIAARKETREAAQEFDWKTLQEKRTWGVADREAIDTHAEKMQELRETGELRRLTQREVYRNQWRQRLLEGRGYQYSASDQKAMQKLSGEIDALRKDIRTLIERK